jgi:hypothetical protein
MGQIVLMDGAEFAKNVGFFCASRFFRGEAAISRGQKVMGK